MNWLKGKVELLIPQIISEAAYLLKSGSFTGFVEKNACNSPDELRKKGVSFSLLSF
jgi:hypothetical protein